MAETVLASSKINPSLVELLLADDMQPGSDPSYQLAKTIYAYHPLGGKMVDTPIRLAMSQTREILIPDGPEERIREAFVRKWKEIGADEKIANVVRLGKIYGAAAIVYGSQDVPSDKQISPENFSKYDLYFNTLDPLNTAGSLVLDQDPNSPTFQKPSIMSVAGKRYHPSRACIFFNEAPLYIHYTTSSFGYTGRSVYQRALFPMKSYVRTMIANDMVARKVGVIVAKMKPAGSIADRAMALLQGIKRNVVKESQTDNVINIGPDEEIETLNLMNADGALTTARKNILEDIAAAAPMPAKILNSESYAEGFGEGTEDAKDVIRYIENERACMQPLYDYFDAIVMRLAWTPEFYAALQNDIPGYKDVSFNKAFYDWANAFEARWPSLLIEPESKKVEVAKVKFEAVVAALEVLLPQMDPANRARLIEWAADSFNDTKDLFPNPMNLDYKTLEDFTPPSTSGEPAEPKPFSPES